MSFSKLMQKLRIIQKAYAVLDKKQDVSEVADSTRRNFVIVGGELRNKGAQAMTFAVVDELRSRYSDHNIYLFSALDSAADQEPYRFEIRSWTFELKSKLILADPADPPRKEVKAEFHELLTHCAGMIDINGYALSSQWGAGMSLGYILNIVIAKLYNIPFYIFPQSIGPFDYALPYRLLLFPLLKKALRYPKKIFVREKQGEVSLRKFTAKNVEPATDIVLSKPEFNLKNIYKSVPPFQALGIRPDSVIIIPSIQIQRKSNQQSYMDALYSGILFLGQHDIPCAIIRHSQEDQGICRVLGDRCAEDALVKVIDQDLSIIEIEHILKQARFIVSSRYHGVVMAYRNAIPAIAIGWAEKYKEFLEAFDQMPYFIPADELDNARITTALEEMLCSRDKESAAIKAKMAQMARQDIFQSIDDRGAQA